MLKKYTHYGIEVIYQVIDTFKNSNFRQALKENGIEWVDLPILEPDVLTYIKDGVRRYACIEECPEDTEAVYITESIPLDMDWKKLIDDCNHQGRGKEPMQMKTKAKVICEKAEEMAYKSAIENCAEKDPFMMAMTEYNSEDLKCAFIALGYSREDILNMDHCDVADDFLDMLK